MSHLASATCLRTVGAAASALLICGACTESDPIEPPIPDTEGLHIAVATPDMIEGRFSTSAGTLSFRAVKDAAGVVDVVYELADLSVVYSVDGVRGTAEVAGEGGAFGEPHAQLLVGFTEAYARAVPEADRARGSLNDVLFSSAGHLAIAPRDQPIASVSVVSERSWTYLPCSCSYNWVYGDYFNNWMYVYTGRYCSAPNNYCPGMCGASCGAFFGHGPYTADCAAHDYGLGSWTTAFDDFMFAYYNC